MNGGPDASSCDDEPSTQSGPRHPDTEEPSGDPDRSTFLGFEMPPPGIVTSEEYCQLQIWPDDDARTWPVEHGEIRIH